MKISSVLISQNKEYLLIKYKKGIFSGKWAFPGDIIEGDIEEEVKDVVYNQLGYGVELLRPICIYSFNNGKNYVYEAEILIDELNINHDIVKEIRWFNFEELFEMDDLAFNVKDSVEKYEEKKFDRSERLDIEV